MTCGLVGIPIVGKSSLFNKLTNSSAPAANYPFCTTTPNEAVLAVEDKRLDFLAKNEKSSKTTYLNIKCVDIAGLVQGASAGRGMGSSFLQAIAEVDIIVHVVRTFKDANISHILATLNPLRDLDFIITELILYDLALVENLLKRKKTTTEEKNILKEKILPSLYDSIMIKDLGLSSAENSSIKSFGFLTQKPMCILLNGPESEDLLYQLRQKNWAFCFCSPQDKDLCLSFAATLMKVQKLVAYFTCGPKETRSWAISKDSTAATAAGKIHSDFAKNFIKGQIIKFSDYQANPSLKNLRMAGKMITVGRKYLMEDADIAFWLTR